MRVVQQKILKDLKDMARDFGFKVNFKRVGHHIDILFFNQSKLLVGCIYLTFSDSCFELQFFQKGVNSKRFLIGYDEEKKIGKMLNFISYRLDV